jgi:hypothetical protein
MRGGHQTHDTAIPAIPQKLSRLVRKVMGHIQATVRLNPWVEPVVIKLLAHIDITLPVPWL